jgi:hypothetical protein
VSCAELSAGEPLAGTATSATRFLMLEHRGRWGRDPLDPETDLPDALRTRADSFDGRVLLLRRPDRRDGDVATFVAEVTRDGGVLRDGSGRELTAPVILVCTHGRRDRCCARLGVPLFDALAGRVDPGRLWQSSHHGGHRFAANLLVLPHGVQLGRVAPEAAGEIASLLVEERIPLEHYRGRTLDTARGQAADAEVRRVLGLDGIGEVRPTADDGRVVDVEVPDGVVHVRVEEVEGLLLPASCGAEPEPSRRLVARLL